MLLPRAPHTCDNEAKVQNRVTIAGIQVGSDLDSAHKNCNIAGLTRISPNFTPLEGEALNMENDQKVIFDKVNKATLNASPVCKSLFSTSGIGGPHTSGSTYIGGRNVSFEVESAYRPESYQRHFWEILSKLNDKRINQKSCSSLKAKLVYEKEKKHHLGGIAAKSNSRHSNGTGVDMTWKGISASRVDQKADKCGLIRNLKHVRGEESHFTLE